MTLHLLNPKFGYVILQLMTLLLLGCSNGRYELYENPSYSIFWEDSDTEVQIKLRGKDYSWGIMFLFDMHRIRGPYTLEVSVWDENKRYDEVTIRKAEVVTDQDKSISFLTENESDKRIIPFKPVQHYNEAIYSFEPAIDLDFDSVKKCKVSVTLFIKEKMREGLEKTFDLEFTKELKKETHFFPDYGSV